MGENLSDGQVSGSVDLEHRFTRTVFPPDRHTFRVLHAPIGVAAGQGGVAGDVEEQRIEADLRRGIGDHDRRVHEVGLSRVGRPRGGELERLRADLITITM